MVCFALRIGWTFDRGVCCVVLGSGLRVLEGLLWHLCWWLVASHARDEDAAPWARFGIAGCSTGRRIVDYGQTVIYFAAEIAGEHAGTLPVLLRGRVFPGL